MSKNKTDKNYAADDIADADIVSKSPAVEAASSTETTAVAPQVDAASEEQKSITGRACFAVNRVEIGVSIETAFLAENGEVMRLPAVFPNRAYAHEQIQALMQLVDSHFDEFERQSSSWFTSAPAA